MTTKPTPKVEHPEMIQAILNGAPPMVATVLRMYMDALAHLVAEQSMRNRAAVDELQKLIEAAQERQIEEGAPKAEDAKKAADAFLASVMGGKS